MTRSMTMLVLVLGGCTGGVEEDLKASGDTGLHAHHDENSDDSTATDTDTLDTESQHDSSTDLTDVTDTDTSTTDTDTSTTDTDTDTTDTDTTAGSTWTGTFVSGSYPTSGSVTLEDDGGVLTLQFDTFSTSNGPDLLVYLSTDQGDSDFVDLGPLTSISGSQTYSVPAGTDLDHYDHVLIWCEDFSVLFGYAELSAM